MNNSHEITILIGSIHGIHDPFALFIGQIPILDGETLQISCPKRTLSQEFGSAMLLIDVPMVLLATPSANKQTCNFGIWTFLEVRFQTQDIEQSLKRHAVRTWNLRTLIFSRSYSSKNRQEKHWGKMGQQNFRKMLAYFIVGVVYWSVLACLFIFCSACICFFTGHEH